MEDPLFVRCIISLRLDYIKHNRVSSKELKLEVQFVLIANTIYI